MKITQLLTQYLTNPIGLDIPQPVLSYTLGAPEAGAAQVAYRILVATTSLALENGQSDLWDSGRVEESRPFGIVYAGTPLLARQRVYWRVRVWDQDGAASDWSPIAVWETGLMGEAWAAPWLGAPSEIDHPVAPRFAMEFEAPDAASIDVARLRVSGLGLFAASMNGQALTDNLFEPGESDFSKTVYYASYDILEHLLTGRNAIGVTLGNGQYVNFLVNPVMRVSTPDGMVESPHHRYQKDDAGFVREGMYGAKRMSAQIELTSRDGSVRIITPNPEDWLVTAGPTRFNDWYGGEDYDATLSDEGWDLPGADRAQWLPGLPIGAPQGGLRGRDFLPARIVERFAAASVIRLDNGHHLVDMGRNVAGFPEIVLSGTTAADAGRVITMLPAECLGDDGGIDQESCTQSGSVKFHCSISNSYTMSGRGEESWHPQFCYQGFRYVEVVGLPFDAMPENFWCCVVRVANEKAGALATSDADLEMIATLTDRSIESNMMFSFTDCPQIEKLGWLETSHLMLPSIAAGFDIRSWIPKIVRDMVDSQTTADDHRAGDPELPGYVPAIAPEYQRIVGLHRDPNWGGACILTPWEHYQFYGDASILVPAYPTMIAYLHYLESHVRNGLLTGYAQMGDWGQIGESTPVPLVENCAYVRLLRTVSDVASLLGHPSEAERYRAQAERVVVSIHADPALFRASGSVYGNGSQTSYGCALFSGIVPPAIEATVLDNLVDAVERRGDHLSSGEVGLKQVFAALAQGGRSDVVLRMVLNETAPSYRVFVDDGLTTLPEYWNYQDLWHGMVRSRNHAMMGHVREWISSYILGLRPIAPGYQTLVIAPELTKKIRQASGHILTSFGQISVGYEVDDDRFTLSAELPVGVVADIALPRDLAAVDAGWNGSSHPHTRWERGVGSGLHRYVIGRDEQVDAYLSHAIVGGRPRAARS